MQFTPSVDWMITKFVVESENGRIIFVKFREGEREGGGKEEGEKRGGGIGAEEREEVGDEGEIGVVFVGDRLI